MNLVIITKCTKTRKYLTKITHQEISLRKIAMLEWGLLGSYTPVSVPFTLSLTTTKVIVQTISLDHRSNHLPLNNGTLHFPLLFLLSTLQFLILSPKHPFIGLINISKSGFYMKDNFR